jgi:hypothetical protein
MKYGLLLAAVTAWPQSGSSTISGSIKDQAEAAVPAAKVKITNVETGASLDTATNDAGLYRAGALGLGTYRVAVEAPGFSPISRGPVTLQVGQTIAIDLVLQVGQQSQTLEVTEAGPLIESQSSNVGQVVDRQMLARLPLPNRAASSLAALAPGVVMIDTGAGTAENYPVFSVAGGRARNQNFTLDGGNASNAVGLTRPQQLTSLPVDAMQEFRVIANNYSAEYGHSTGGIVIMSTRSGTNQYHGSLFESLENDVLNGRNFFAAKRAPVRLNQYGGSFGGPIRKDKTHFFVTWEQTRQLTSFDTTSTVPTLLNRQGDFSDLRSTAGKLIQIYDPATGSTASTRQPFLGNVIPIQRFDPVAFAAMSYFPQPNRPGTVTNANNYIGSSRSALSRDIAVGRLDHQFRPADLMTARYYINDANTDNTGAYGIPAADPLADITDVRVQTILGSYTHIFSPAITNDFRYTYLRRKFLDSRPGLGENLAAEDWLGRSKRRRLSGLDNPRLRSSRGVCGRKRDRPKHGGGAGKSQHDLPLSNSHPRSAVSGIPLLVSRQACLEVRRGVSRRGERRDPRSRLGRQFHDQSTDHGSSRLFCHHGEFVGQLSSGRGKCGEHPGVR